MDKDKLKLLDGQLYEYFHIREDLRNNAVGIELWNSIKEDKELLKEAIKVTKNKWKEDTVCGPTICDMLLVDFQNVDPDIYQELINTIYSNPRIARICLDSDRNDSFLLMSLWNFDLELTKEQKEFAVSEAMNSTVNVHGQGSFDISYWILRNPNWTKEEKKKLVMSFFDDDDYYDETLEQWEWAVVNDPANYQGKAFPPFDRYDLFYTTDYGYEYLLGYHKDKKTTDRLWEEIEFCKMMHKLRPMQFETAKVDIRAQITVTNDNGNLMGDTEKVLERIAKMLDFSFSIESSSDDSKTVVYQKKFPQN